MYVFFVIFALSVSHASTCTDNEKMDAASTFSSSYAHASASSSSSSSSFASASSSSFSSSDDSNGGPCVYDQCTPTCSRPDPECPQTSGSSSDCNCDPGYILSEKGGECVKLEDCQKYLNCNGDRNSSYRECPNTCVSTCSNPNPIQCKQKCEPGCQCDPLYVLSNEGLCISPDDCPGGNPCGENKTFVYCNVKCPTLFCPVNDNRGIIACSPPYPCPSGCSCKQNYKYLSVDDQRCILASDCPPVKCTRQNEVWNSCLPPCYTESCRDLNKPVSECIRSGPDCQPQCVCQEGYRRNDTDICIPESDCASAA